MSNKRRRWLSAIGAVLAVGGLATTIAVADDGKHKNPFTQILNKLDQIVSKLDSGSGSGNHTLRWDTNHPSASRFVILAAFHNQAVLDKNTGLVWEQAPDATPRHWNEARDHCVGRAVDGTVGWRLPSVIELTSVQDPSLASPFVPTGVFTGIIRYGYWSASTYVGGSTNAWLVGFFDGHVNNSPKIVDVSPPYVWCVRGPMQEHEY